MKKWWWEFSVRTVLSLLKPSNYTEDRYSDDVRLSDEAKENLVLEEIRRRYDFDESRRKAVESKTSIIIGIDTLIVALLPSFPFGLTSLIVILAPVIVSVLLGVRVLRIRGYKVAGKDDVRDYMGYVTGELDQSLMRRLIRSYIESVNHNSQLNDDKYANYKWAYRFTVSSILLIAIVVIAESVCSSESIRCAALLR